MKSYLKNIFGEKVIEIDEETNVLTALQDCRVKIDTSVSIPKPPEEK